MIIKLNRQHQDVDMKKNNVSPVAFRSFLASLLFCIFCFQDVQAKPGKAPQKPQSSQTVKQPPKPADAVWDRVQRPFEEAVAEMISNVRRSEELNSAEKEILAEGINLFSRTERGKWLLCHAPRNMKFKKLPQEVSASGVFVTDLSISMNERHFNAVSSSQKPDQRQKALYNMIGTLAHEMTHACQHMFSICKMQGASTIDEMILFKLSELQAVLEAREVGDQLLDLSAFRDFKEKQPRYYSGSLLRRIAERKRRAGLSSADVRRSARTEFIKVYWRNNFDRSKSNKDVFSDYKTIGWNSLYNSKFFGIEKKPYRAEGDSIDGVLRKAASFMQVDIEPGFFKRERAFQYEHGRLVGYLNGQKDHEMDYLTVGSVKKTWHNNRLRLVALMNSRGIQSGSFKDYWDGTQRVRATYAIENRQAVGIYKEYDYSGNQVAEIPFKDGRANGMGWFFERGKRVPKRFSYGVCYDINEKGNSNLEQQIRRIQERRGKNRPD